MAGWRQPAAPTPQFDMWPQMASIAPMEIEGRGMSRDRPNIVSKAALAAWRRLWRPTYRPEEHYMRGPGPKTLSKIGEMYRAESNATLQDRLPEAWLELVQSLEHDHQPSRSRRGVNR
jgi:hypothetical protein